MKTKAGHMTIAEVREQMDNGSLVANRVYQRAAGLWPQSAQRYFIDTIIKDYPFQSVYLHEYVQPKTKRIKKDIVDGQQRLTTIHDFVSDAIPLGKESGDLRGKVFSDLDEDLQDIILSYSVPVITITRSNENEILEMFRRMNAFMVPLNSAEKRHSQFHGDFKWFINRLADEFSPLFNSFGVLTEKQIVRMSDAELLTDLVDILQRGIKNRQPAALTKLYKDNDEKFAREEEFEEKVYETLDYIRANLSQISGTFMSKSYAFYSLVAALMHNRWGIIDDNKGYMLGAEPTGKFAASTETAVRNLLILAGAHEEGDREGDFSDYVLACSSSTHRIAQRVTRTRWVLKALNGKI